MKTGEEYYTLESIQIWPKGITIPAGSYVTVSRPLPFVAEVAVVRDRAGVEALAHRAQLERADMLPVAMGQINLWTGEVSDNV